MSSILINSWISTNPLKQRPIDRLDFSRTEKSEREHGEIHREIRANILRRQNLNALSENLVSLHGGIRIIAVSFPVKELARGQNPHITPFIMCNWPKSEALAFQASLSGSITHITLQFLAVLNNKTKHQWSSGEMNYSDTKKVT